jgi:Tol biopolymer transport system component
MTVSNWESTRLVVALAAAATLLGIGLGLPARSRAAFPGANGRVAYDSNQGGADPEIMSGLPDGSGSVQLTTNTVDDKQPAWSADGKKVAYSHFNSVSGVFEIWTMSADGSGQAPAASAAQSLTHPTWSRDGSRIAFVYAFSPTDDDIYRVDTSGLNANFTSVENTADNERDPAYAPNSNKIAFSRSSGGPYELWTVDDSGSAPTVVLARAGHNLTEPNWSPDGAQFAYQYQFSATDEDVYRVDTDGTNNGAVTADAVNERAPAWAPEGNMIAYGRVGSDVEIYTVNPDGTGRTPLETRAATADDQPDWQPVVTAQVRPKGASPMFLSLVPAFKNCTSANATHDPPFGTGSCTPPRQTSSDLTVGEPMVNGKGANFIGFIKFKTVTGDGQVIVSASDVRCAHSQPGRCVSGPLSDYTGILHFRTVFRLTDRSNTGGRAGTVLDVGFNVDVPCTATADPTIGSKCSVNTTLNTLYAGLVVPGRRASWELQQPQLLDDPALNVFAVPGSFYP